MTEKADQSLFEHTGDYSCPVQNLYEWHTRPGALERLLPPWQKISVLARQGGIDPGARVQLKMHIGPFTCLFSARHTENHPPGFFKDIQEEGPFSSWAHSHYFSGTGQQATLHDRVEYSLPGHRFLPGFIHRQVKGQLRRLFRHRTSLLAEDIALHNRCGTAPLKILVTGASGVIGRDLLPMLTTGGQQVYTLVRRKPDPAKNEIYWDPAKGILNEEELPDIDGVIHLAGEYIGLSRWTEEKKRRVIDSRIKGTRLLAETFAARTRKPESFLCASAIGYYGDTGQLLIDETSPPGTDFISEVCTLWEKGTEPARDAGIRTVFMRLGVGLTPRGGALQRILASSPLGFVRRFGGGRQYISWISRDDMVAAMLHTLCCRELAGPVNIAAPEPVTNADFMRTIARVSGRPLLISLPGWFLRMIYGQMASEILLSGCRVSTEKLQKSGFKFRHPTLESALGSLLGKE